MIEHVVTIFSLPFRKIRYRTGIDTQTLATTGERLVF
ncbi:Uncharacterised protein [Segatella copri]|nr:Uncharacterised protein [Segatella copri]